jgi:threonine/homoserine/homoserine lactone efflux protein
VQVAIETDSRRLLNIFRDGVIVNLTNPKTALFLLAFLPQFVVPDGNSLSHQLLMLGMTFVAVAVLTDIGYVIAAGTVRARLARSDRKRRWPRWLAGGLYLALGAAGLVDAVQRLVTG